MFFVEGRFEEMASGSRNKRNRVQYDFVHRLHTQQPVDIVRIVWCRFRKIAGVCAVFSPFVQHGDGIVRCDTVKGVLPDFVKTATVNDWSAICWADGKLYEGMKLDSLEIFDRVGGGDSFASGLIYGLMTEGDPRYAVNCGIAHGALAMTTPGDTSMASKREVEAVMNGAGARVQR